ncbi:MAG: class I SAM-dependent methyltransferase [Thermoplasmata archaeon]|nr:class I SAM-dependent methyltransferase [Thermoplasmata archaeon]
MDREWQRYEGTAQRELFRELRVRFLRKHAPPKEGPLLEVGPGPGRFTPHLGGAGQPRVLLDLSQEALRQVRRRVPPVSRGGSATIHLVRGNGRRPPLHEGAFSGVYLLGNLVGFAADAADDLLLASARAVAPGGLILLELSPGPGERSVYLHRLPPGALARWLRAPLPAVLPRVEREGFAPLPPRRRDSSSFARTSIEAAESALLPLGFRREGALSVAPALGSDPERCTAVRASARGWAHLLDLEESVGGVERRWARGSAVLVALRRAE